MNILLTAINAKYIHSNLAVYSLRACAGEYRDPPGISGMTVGIKIVVAGVFRTLAQISE